MLINANQNIYWAKYMMHKIFTEYSSNKFLFRQTEGLALNTTESRLKTKLYFVKKKKKVEEEELRQV